jgi:putative SOS response-associated peptidase YedK
MCGRFTLTTPGQELAEAFGLDEVPSLSPRYNIAPSQPLLVVRLSSPEGHPRTDWLRWGLVPAGTSEASRPFINARAETAADKPSFREAFRRRRCLVPADGFYEWAKEGGRRQPYLFRRADRRPFAFAGLWEPAPQANLAGTCVLLTTAPNELARPIHDRMPVILDPADHARWLDPALTSPFALRPLLRPYPSGVMTAFRVSRAVNDPSQDGPDCLRPL